MEGDDLTRSIRPLDEASDPLNFYILGVCTGNGFNKLEFVHVHYNQATPASKLQVRLLRREQLPIRSHVRSSILDSLRDANRNPSARPHANDLLGHLFGEGIREFCSKHKIERHSIDLVGTHLPNLPEKAHLGTEKENHLHAWNAIITADSGITSVNHFSVTGSARGRTQLSPKAFVDRLYLQHPTKFRACLNIAEVAYLSFIPPQSHIATLPCISRECGPGSVLINYATQYCTSNTRIEDEEGKLASEGQVDEDVVDRFLQAHDFLRIIPTPSMAREMFGAHEAQELIDECVHRNLSEEDTMAVATRLIAKNLVQQYFKLLRGLYPAEQAVDELFLCGPYAKNLNIVDYIEEKLPEGVIIKPLEDVGLPGDTHDAFCYAHLALEVALREATERDSEERPSSSHNTQTQVVKGRVTTGPRWTGFVNTVRSFRNGQALPLASGVVVIGGLEDAVESPDL